MSSFRIRLTHEPETKLTRESLQQGLSLSYRIVLDVRNIHLNAESCAALVTTTSLSKFYEFFLLESPLLIDNAKVWVNCQPDTLVVIRSARGRAKELCDELIAHRLVANWNFLHFISKEHVVIFKDSDFDEMWSNFEEKMSEYELSYKWKRKIQAPQIQKSQIGGTFGLNGVSQEYGDIKAQDKAKDKSKGKLKTKSNPTQRPNTRNETVTPDDYLPPKGTASNPNSAPHSKAPSKPQSRVHSPPKMHVDTIEREISQTYAAVLLPYIPYDQFQVQFQTLVSKIKERDTNILEIISSKTLGLGLIIFHSAKSCLDYVQLRTMSLGGYVFSVLATFPIECILDDFSGSQLCLEKARIALGDYGAKVSILEKLDALHVSFQSITDFFRVESENLFVDSVPIKLVPFCLYAYGPKFPNDLHTTLDKFNSALRGKLGSMNLVDSRLLYLYITDYTTFDSLIKRGELLLDKDMVYLNNRDLDGNSKKTIPVAARQNTIAHGTRHPGSKHIFTPTLESSQPANYHGNAPDMGPHALVYQNKSDLDNYRMYYESIFIVDSLSKFHNVWNIPPNYPVFHTKWDSEVWLKFMRTFEAESVNPQGRDSKTMHKCLVSMHLLAMTTTLECIRKGKYVSTKGDLFSLPPPKQSIISGLPVQINKRMPVGDCTVRVVGVDAVTAAESLSQEGLKVALMSAAHQERPGGDYRARIGQQEESLFRQSNICQSLDSNWNIVVQTNHAIGYPLPKLVNGRGGGVSTRDVVVFRKSCRDGYAFLNMPFICDVLSISPIANPRLERDGDMNLTDLHLTREKIEWCIRTAIDNGVDALVLTPFGCDGLHRNPSHNIAEVFRSLLSQFAVFFKKVVIASNEDDPDDPHSNFRVFSEKLGRASFSNEYSKIVSNLPSCPSGGLCRELSHLPHQSSFWHPRLCSNPYCSDYTLHHHFLFSHPDAMYQT